MLFIADSYNTGNDAHYHYGLTDSPVYLPVMAVMLLLQTALMYVNNLVLVPRLLARRHVLLYIPAALALAASVALATTTVMKLALPQLRVDQLHHAGFTMTAISPSWKPGALLAEMQAFFFSDVVWLVAFTLAWFANDYARQHRALRESEARRMKTELAFLRNQLNPHFLFNTLNNIYGLVHLKSDAAPELILKLSALLRYLLYETNVDAIPFAKERAAIEAYAGIEALRLPDDARLHLDLAADRDYAVPPLLWLPLLENSFKHGTRLIREPVVLDFSFRIAGGLLSIRASNRFEPREPGDSEARGLGLDNLRKRLQILYPGRHLIDVTTENRVYSIALELKLNDA